MARLPPSPSSNEEMDLKPKVPPNPFEISPILIGKNVDFANFSIEAPVLHIEECFERTGWVSVATTEEHAYLRLMKEFYRKMHVAPSF